MEFISVPFRLLGGLCLFLYGMKVMSDGIQQAAGDRLQKALNFMTKNRFVAVLTGFVVTAIIQSSSAVTVMIVSFVNAGLLTLTQAIGVVMGANIGTTVTAWIVSLVGFSLNISEMALPMIGFGFILSIIKWKHRTMGEILLGLGFLFLGLDYLTRAMPDIGDRFNFVAAVADRGFLTYFIGMCAGLAMTLIVNSSSAATAIMLAMAYNGIVSYEMTAAMVLGANVATTIHAAIASIGTKTAARQTALVHVLFNVIGTCWALPLLKPLLSIVDVLVPGTMTGAAGDPLVTTHLAMLHTVFNFTNTIVFLPFVKPFAALVTRVIKDKKEEPEASGQYRLEYISGTFRETPEFNIIRAEKEIRDMAGLASDMYGRFSAALGSMAETPLSEDGINALIADMREKESYADEMREALTAFLMECTREQLNRQSQRRVSRLIRIVADLEDMTDDCFSISFILERSVKKNQVFKSKEMNALIPYVGLVSEFLDFLKSHLGSHLTSDQAVWADELENRIDESRNKLRRLGRKRLEAGKDVKTELLFIDMVRRIEKLGDYCHNITESMAR